MNGPKFSSPCAYLLLSSHLVCCYSFLVWSCFSWLLLSTALAGGLTVSPLGLAAADIRDQRNPQVIRYLWLGHLAAKERVRWWRIINGHTAILSREADLVAVTILPGTEDRIARINLADYGWDRKTWDQLPDPYFTAEVEVIIKEIKKVPYGYNDGPGGSFRITEYKNEETETKKKVRAIAPWLTEGAKDKEAAAILAEKTGSVVPVVRGDWFIGHTAIQEGRGGTGYYDFLQIKKRQDYEDLIGFDEKKSKKARLTELLEAISESGIAQQPRRIQVDYALAGRYFRTNDNKLAVDENNPLEVLDRKNFKHLAEEAFTLKANGFWLTGLWSDQGELQTVAPDFIGYNHPSPTNDGRIHVNLGCVGCHYQTFGTDGLVSFDGFFRKLFQRRALRGVDEDQLRELRQQYFRDLAEPMEDQRKIHARAVKRATGWEPKEWAKEYLSAFYEYEGRVSSARAARDLGVTEVEFKIRVETYIATTGVGTFQLAALVDGDKIGIRQWEQEYPRAQLVIRGYQQWPK